MKKLPVKSQSQTNEKSSKKFFGVLRRLAKSDSSIKNKMKVTVYNEDITNEKKQIFIAPSMFTTFINRNKNLNNHNSTENTSKNIIETSIIENEIQSPQNTEIKDYPDSSDFGDDDE